ncbi:hypothetical protein [Nitrosococcus wardiae]|nr:hypothetical protein [Nitrosococcus wardiae]
MKPRQCLLLTAHAIAQLREDNKPSQPLSPEEFQTPESEEKRK